MTGGQNGRHYQIGDQIGNDGPNRAMAPTVIFGAGHHLAGPWRNRSRVAGVQTMPELFIAVQIIRPETLPTGRLNGPY